MKMLTPRAGFHMRMLLLGISAKIRLPDGSQSGPSVHLKPVAIRSRTGWAGMSLFTAGSRRSMDVVTKTVAEGVASSLEPACTTDRGPSAFAASSITALRAQIELFFVTACHLLAFSLYVLYKWRRHASNGEGMHR